MTILVLGGSTAAAGDIPATDLVHYWRADQGVTETSNDVSAWAEVDGFGTWDWAQGTASEQPLFVASSIDGHPGIDFNGTSHLLEVTTDALAQPIHMFAVMAFRSWTAGDLPFVQSGRPTFEQAGSTPDMGHRAGAGSPVNKLTPGTGYILCQSEWDGASSAMEEDDLGRVTGEDPGANGFAAATGLGLGGLHGAGGGWADMLVAEIALYNAIQTGGALTAIKAYFAARYPSLG